MTEAINPEPFRLNDIVEFAGKPETRGVLVRLFPGVGTAAINTGKKWVQGQIADLQLLERRGKTRGPNNRVYPAWCRWYAEMADLTPAQVWAIRKTPPPAWHARAGGGSE